MKTTIQQQIKAVQDARNLIRKIKVENATDLIWFIEVDKALNDAGSTLAAINLNPEIKKLLEP